MMSHKSQILLNNISMVLEIPLHSLTSETPLARRRSCLTDRSTNAVWSLNLDRFARREQNMLPPTGHQLCPSTAMWAEPRSCTSTLPIFSSRTSRESLRFATSTVSWIVYYLLDDYKCLILENAWMILMLHTCRYLDILIHINFNFFYFWWCKCMSFFVFVCF